MERQVSVGARRPPGSKQDQGGEGQRGWGRRDLENAGGVGQGEDLKTTGAENDGGRLDVVGSQDQRHGDERHSQTNEDDGSGGQRGQAEAKRLSLGLRGAQRRPEFV